MKWLELALSMLTTLIAASELRPRISMMGKGVKLAQCYLDGSSVASMAVPPILLVFRLVGKDVPGIDCDPSEYRQWA